MVKHYLTSPSFYHLPCSMANRNVGKTMLILGLNYICSHRLRPGCILDQVWYLIVSIPGLCTVTTTLSSIFLVFDVLLCNWSRVSKHVVDIVNLTVLVARWWVQLQTLWWFRLKDISNDKMVGALWFGCLSGPLGFTCWISFAPVFIFIYCWDLIFALSLCYIFIYMFWEMMHW